MKYCLEFSLERHVQEIKYFINLNIDLIQNIMFVSFKAISYLKSYVTS